MTARIMQLRLSAQQYSAEHCLNPLKPLDKRFVIFEIGRLEVGLSESMCHLTQQT